MFHCSEETWHLLREMLQDEVRLKHFSVGDKRQAPHLPTVWKYIEKRQRDAGAFSAAQKEKYRVCKTVNILAGDFNIGYILPLHGKPLCSLFSHA